MTQAAIDRNADRACSSAEEHIRRAAILRSGLNLSGPNPTSRDLRWLSTMVLVDVPFADRVWALPVRTASDPVMSWCDFHGRQHCPVTEWPPPDGGVAP